MDINSFKVYALNLSAMTISTVDGIELTLKLMLLVVSIGYTLQKWYQLRNKK
jgi:hypothetical protein|tara:strand:+ start:24409 stop:24564 length:156 start_codon:yes stop_codon:yes gene_type:complete